MPTSRRTLREWKLRSSGHAGATVKTRTARVLNRHVPADATSRSSSGLAARRTPRATSTDSGDGGDGVKCGYLISVCISVFPSCHAPFPTLAFPLLSPAPPAPKGGSTHLSRSHVVRWARGCAALVPAPSRPSSPRPREARQFRKGLLLFCTSKSSVPRCDSSRVRRLLSNVRWATQLVAGQRARRTRKAWHGTKPINNEILHRPCFHTNSPR